MTYNEIISDIDFICGSTSATYSTTDKNRNINTKYQEVATTIWQSDGTWNFDDANNTDTPIAYRSLGHLSATYLIPTTALRVRQIEIKDSNSQWSVLTPITLDELSISPEEYMTGGGLPLRYMLDGTQITFYPAPHSAYCTLTSGAAVRLSREVTNFPTTATTTTPGFPSAFHKILSYSASLDFLRDSKDREFLMAQKDRLERGLVRFYQGRSDDHNPVIRPTNKRFWRNYT